MVRGNILSNENNALKTGDRVVFDLESTRGVVGKGSGVITRLSPTGVPMIQPDKLLPGGSRIVNIRRTEVKRG